MEAALKTVTIIGAGTMGHALALIFARAGCRVFLTDISEQVLKRARGLILSHLETLKAFGEPLEDPALILERVSTSTDFGDSVPQSDLIIEAIIENVESKRQLFHELAGRLNAAHPIVASNTSYLDVFPLVPVALQKKFLITHFFTPPYVVPLVEVVGSAHTDPQALSQVRQWLQDLGMVVVTLKKFMPGFIVNRLQRAIGREVLYMIDEGLADPQEIDRAVKASLGVRLPILGVVARYDFAGLDMAMRALKAPSIGLATQDRVSPTLTKLVEQGHLGVKSGKGFFDYGDRPLAEILRERDHKLLQVRRLLQELGEL